MGKKEKDDAPSVNTTANRDIIQRLNFLYQASFFLQSIAPQSSTDHFSANVAEGNNTETFHSEVKQSVDTPENTKEKMKRRKSKRKTSSDLARNYIHCMRLVAQKTTVKIDPSLKRHLCFSCNTALVPGFSASIHVKGSTCHGHRMLYSCLHCKATKSVPAPVTIGPELTSSPSIFGHRDIQKRKVAAGHLPLFARPNVGHVIFRGNERLFPG